MTSAEKRLYHYRWDRFQKRQERIYTTKFRAALKTQIRQYASLGYITSAPIYEVLVDLYTTVGPLWSNQARLSTTRQQVKARMPMGFSQRIVDLMKSYYGIDLLNDAEMITDYTREVIRKVLSDAALSGASINEQVRAMEANSELSGMRAARIARTETVTAANGAAVIQAKESGFAKNKIWLSVNDKRVRHNHRLVDNVTVGIDEPFSVGGELMLQPGARKQTNGLDVSAKNVVNCRCVVAFQVIE
jgi:uncharacterized protein with gpF-like domain